MNRNTELSSYLDFEQDRLNAEFPKYSNTTLALFQMVLDFLNTDFEGMSDNRIYRCFLSSFKDIICFAFEKDVSKAYLRCFFKGLNNNTFVGYLGKCATSRANDIRLVMERFVDFFTATWQGYDNDKKQVLENIIRTIDYWM